MNSTEKIAMLLDTLQECVKQNAKEITGFTANPNDPSILCLGRLPKGEDGKDNHNYGLVTGSPLSLTILLLEVMGNNEVIRNLILGVAASFKMYDTLFSKK